MDFIESYEDIAQIRSDLDELGEELIRKTDVATTSLNDRLLKTDVGRALLADQVLKTDVARASLVDRLRKTDLARALHADLSNTRKHQSYRWHHDFEDLNGELTEALEALFRRPYWRRVWIIQEVVVARKIRIFCGPEVTSLERFERVVAKHPIGQRMLKIGHVPNFEAFREAAEDKGSFCLLKMLYFSRESLATDRRDKVYALLGMHQTARPSSHPQTTKLCPKQSFRT
jgi:hypothetical protein